MKIKLISLLTASLLPMMAIVGCTGKPSTPASSTTTTTAVTTPTPEDPNPPEEEGGVDLVLFIGQSNMAGRGVARSATKVKEGHAYEFRAISDPTRLYPLEEPFGVNENNPASGVNENKKTGSMVSAFCESYYAATGRAIVAVSCSKGGEKIGFFDKGTKVYEDACQRVKSAQEFLKQEYENGNKDLKLRGTYVVWLQGESDAIVRNTAEDYGAMLTAFKNAVKETVGIEVFGIIKVGYFCRTVSWLRPQFDEESGRLADEAIMASQEKLAETDPDFAILTRVCPDMSLDPKWLNPWAEGHFNNAAMTVIGTEAGRALARYFR